MSHTPNSQDDQDKNQPDDSQTNQSRSLENGEQSETEHVLQEIEKMPPEKQEAVFSAIKYSGPLPPSKELQAYEQVVPAIKEVANFGLRIRRPVSPGTRRRLTGTRGRIIIRPYYPLANVSWIKLAVLLRITDNE